MKTIKEALVNATPEVAPETIPAPGSYLPRKVANNIVQTIHQARINLLTITNQLEEALESGTPATEGTVAVTGPEVQAALGDNLKKTRAQLKSFRRIASA